MPMDNAFMDRQLRRLRRMGAWAREGRLLPELWARRRFVQDRAAHLRERLMWKLGRRIDMRARLGLPPALPVPRPDTLALPTSDAPLVSVIIPAYGQVAHSLRCLASLAAHPPSLPFEVILVEDASGAADAALPRAVQGLRYVERTANLGFLRSCNDAATLARGEFLFFLNNDTEVMPGAIDRLHAALTGEHPGFPGPVGLAGARLLYPAGWLQEAGGILWRDGSAWNWGNGRDPRGAEFSYLREADYCSGAAIMLPRAAWDAMGGFDEHYLPAYCEDSDLAFRLRAAGWRTLYVPEATVIHDEGVSHGTDTTKGVKAHQVENARRLAARHAAALARHEPHGTSLLRARDRAPEGGARKVVLVADNNMPTPDRDAGSRTVQAMIEALLRQGHCVKFWSLNGLDMPPYTEALRRLGVECPTWPGRPPFADWLAENDGQLDRVLLSRPHVAGELLPALRRHAPQAPILFYGHDLHHARLLREAEAGPDRAEALRAEAAAMLRAEQAAWEDCDFSLYPSEEEAVAVRGLLPAARVGAVFPYVLPPVPRPEPAGRQGLVFVAGFAHGPNVDAAIWLVREVLPLIRAGAPGVELALIGSSPTPAVQALAGDGVEVTGFVSDAELDRRYAGARVAICPLRYGAGIKLKVVEALHRGIPLVTTPTGVQGLPAPPCAVAGTPEALAAAALRLLRDDAAWREAAAAQHAYVGDRFSMARLQATLDDAFEEASTARLLRSASPEAILRAARRLSAPA